MSYMNDDCDPFGMPYPEEEESTSRELPRQRPLSKDDEKYVLYKDFGVLHILKDGEIRWRDVYPGSRNQLFEIVEELNKQNKIRDDKFNKLDEEIKELKTENKQLGQELNEQECRKWACIDEAHRLSLQNEQFKKQIKIYEVFLKYNDLDFDWTEFCTADECINENIKSIDEEIDCKDCLYLEDLKK